MKQKILILLIGCLLFLISVSVFQLLTVPASQTLPLLSPLAEVKAQLVQSKKTPSTTPGVKPTRGVFELESLFHYHDPLKAQTEQSDEITIIATGDVIPARSVNSKMVTLHDFTYPFVKTALFLKKADAVFINLESPFVSGCQPTLEGMVFCGDERSVDGLSYAGVSVASVANNHAGNYGVEGMKNTVRLLSSKNIKITGLGEPAILQIKDKTFGFLGFNDIGIGGAGIAQADPKQITLEVSTLRHQVDFVIVTFHWGIEYQSDPTERQRFLAHAAIDAGADLIIGNHPHWVQGVEQYKGKFITYAHGNYVFDQMWSQETREGVIGQYTFDRNGLKNVAFFPVIIDDYSQPRFATEVEGLNILNRMKTSSEKLLTQ